MDLVNNMSPNPVEQQQTLQPINEVTQPELEVVEQQQLPSEDSVVQESVTEESKALELRRSQCSTKGIPSRKLNLLTQIYAMVQEIADAKEKAKLKAIEEEILLIFKDLKAVMPILKKDIPEDAEILRSFIFLVEKYLANGTFDKMKACLMAYGAQQDRVLYPQRSSPMVSIHAIMTGLAMAVSVGGYILAKINVKGAYLQTEMMGAPIFMQMDKKLARMIVEFLLDLKWFITPEDYT